MNIIEWDVDDINQTVESLDEMLLANNLMNDLNQIDPDDIKTDAAIALCKMKLVGEFNALLVRNMEEYLVDAEIYVLTWDGEASAGGDMFKLEFLHLPAIIDGTIFK
ncbi:hypothetical protein Q0N12_17765 [Rossellomorea marisflavi]|uniref:hypothetical protein n=1 Tax=Rossellomorea marisflavi TaxID=189381 RepID=UPI003458BB14